YRGGPSPFLVGEPPLAAAARSWDTHAAYEPRAQARGLRQRGCLRVSPGGLPMGGNASFPPFRRLGEADLKQMRQAGLEVEVKLDLSHNENILIICDGRPVAIKKIHLDLGVKPGRGAGG